MKRRPRFRPKVEQLEDRCCPSVTASITAGSLVITGSALDLTVTEISQDRFQVIADNITKGTFTVLHDVDINLSSGPSAQVTLDLDHNVAPGNVNIHLGSGSPTLSIFGGTIEGNLNVVGGSGADSIELGGQIGTGPFQPIPFTLPIPPTPPLIPPLLPLLPASTMANPIPGSFVRRPGDVPPTLGTSLRVEGNTSVQLGGNAQSILRVDPWVELDGSLTAAQVGQIDLMLGSNVGGDVVLQGAAGGMSVNLTGDIQGSVSVLGGTGYDSFDLGSFGTIAGDLQTVNVENVQLEGFSGVKGGVSVRGATNLQVAGQIGLGMTYVGVGHTQETVTVQSSAMIGGDVGISLGSGSDTADLEGVIGGNLVVSAGAGFDTLLLGGWVQHTATINLGSGVDTVVVSGTVGPVVGTTGELAINGGLGRASLKFLGTAAVDGTLLVTLGSGNDIVAVDAGFQAAAGLVDGGGGRNGLSGTFPAGIVVKHFQYGFFSP
jgi:hypothetical protein